MNKSKAWLVEKYIDNEMSYVEISKIAGVSNVTIKNWIVKCGINTRSRSEQATIANKKAKRWQGDKNPARNPEFLNKMMANRRSYKGKDNPNYGKKASKKTRFKIGVKMRKDTTPLYNQIRNSQKANKWSRDVLKRDNYICQKCSKRGGDLESHHIIAFKVLFNKLKIKSFKQAMETKELWNLKNGMTLCKHCHRLTDSYGGNA